jgi:hypothetical protein
MTDVIQQTSFVGVKALTAVRIAIDVWQVLVRGRISHGCMRRSLKVVIEVAAGISNVPTSLSAPQLRESAVQMLVHPFRVRWFECRYVPQRSISPVNLTTAHSLKKSGIR